MAPTATCLLACAALAAALSAAARPAPRLDAQFDARTGEWTGLIVDGRNVVAGAAPGLEVNAGADSLPPPAQWVRLGEERTPGRVTVTRRCGRWHVREEARIAGDELRRSVTLTWQGDRPARVVGTALRAGPLRLAASAAAAARDWYLLPGNFPVRKHAWAALTPGRQAAEVGWTRGDYGLAIVHSPSARLSLVAAYRFDHDQARISVEEATGGVALVHRFDTVAVVPPGGTLTIGEQVLRVVRGAEAALAAAVSDLSGRLDNGPPADRPAGFERTVLYEAHPWGRLEAAGAGDRAMRFTRLAELMPWYRDLGVTALWMLPVSWPPPWVYTLPDFNRVAPELGTPEELKALVRAAHGAGIRVLADLVVYGIHPDSPETKRHPAEAWCRDEAGSPVRVWGDSVLAADTSHPRWQARIGEVCSTWAREYGFDGARLDCIGWGQTVNWKSAGRANDAVAYGGLQLNAVVRRAFREGNAAAFTLPEGGKPLVFRHSDTVFDYPLYLAMRDVTTTLDLAAWVRDLRLWLEWERHCYPRAALPGLVRFLENHDTVPAAEYFGVGPSQALMAICCLIQGTPLVYQEQETGYSRDLAAWLRLRNAEPCFHSGDADYQSVKASDGRVFAFLRRSGARRAVVAVNVTGEEIACRLAWPGGAASVRVPAYRPVALLVLPGKPARSLLPARSPALEPGTWRIETAEGTLSDVFAPMAARVRPGERLTDALPVLRRAWDPLAGGLLDGTARADIELRRPDGALQRAEVDVARASAVSVDDPACDGREARIVVEPASARVHSGTGGAAPRSIPGVDAQFVRLASGAASLTLARRHGGVPVDWRAGPGRPSVIEPGGDLYADQGLFDNRAFGSADGETNARLDAEAGRARFRGTLRGRAWNGVATCYVQGPATPYSLRWQPRGDGRFDLAMTVTPGADRPAGPAFAALRLPLVGVKKWERGAQGGPAAGGSDARLGSGGPGAPLKVVTAGGTLTVEPREGIANVFLIDHGGGRASLFVCLLDGASPALKGGAAVEGAVTLRLTP